MSSPSGDAPLQVRPGSFEEALANGQALLDRHPEAALKQAETLLKPGPEPRALRLAAAACRRLDRPADAEAAELAAIMASHGFPQLEQAARAEADGRSADAQALTEQFLRAHPDDLLALTIGAEAAINLRDLEQAEAMLRTVLERAPSFLRAVMLLAKCLVLQARVRDGIALLDGVIERKPDNEPALKYLAQLLAEVGDHERVAAVHERLLSLDASQRDRWIHYAHHLRFLGRDADSIQALRRALSLDPHGGAAWWALTNYFPASLEAGDIETIREALADRDGSNEDAGPLHIALAILSDRRGDYEDAFNHWAAGKKLRLAAQPYDPGVVTAEVDETLLCFTPELYAAHAASGSADASPIFMIGMPRSGSTLVERVLGRHSAIEGAGELQVMHRLMERIRKRASRRGGYRSYIESMSPDEATELGQWYVERSRDYRHTAKPLFVDKLNVNWLHLGLIRLILPNARILDVRRSALDCGWSNFRMLFAEGHPASNDLRHIGRFYRDYVRLVDGISAAAPGAVLQVRYEDVVTDIEAATRRICTFIGVDFEPATIDFHLSTEPVATPSSEQVRRPLNRDSIGAAEPYQRWLGPLIEELGPLLE